MQMRIDENAGSAAWCSWHDAVICELSTLVVIPVLLSVLLYLNVRFYPRRLVVTTLLMVVAAAVVPTFIVNFVFLVHFSTIMVPYFFNRITLTCNVYEYPLT
jgi:hypothetical protein